MHKKRILCDGLIQLGVQPRPLTHGFVPVRLHSAFYKTRRTIWTVDDRTILIFCTVYWKWVLQNTADTSGTHRFHSVIQYHLNKWLYFQKANKRPTNLRSKDYFLKCFVLIDLKMGQLTHQDIGQMQMYVNFYTRELMNEGDSSTYHWIQFQSYRFP